MKKKTKYIKVFIGRFQPFHNGHLKCLRAAIDTSDLVFVVLGSSRARHSYLRTLTNPWNNEERQNMIEWALNPKERKKVIVIDQPDMPGGDNQWMQCIKDQVQEIANDSFKDCKFVYTLIGCDKGKDTYYLKLFKDWNRDLMPKKEVLNGRDIRKAYFNYLNTSDKVPPTTEVFLRMWAEYNQDFFNFLRFEQLKLEKK